MYAHLEDRFRRISTTFKLLGILYLWSRLFEQLRIQLSQGQAHIRTFLFQRLKLRQTLRLIGRCFFR